MKIWHPPHWLSSKGPNYQRGVLLISAGAIEGLWRKNAAGRSPSGSCSCTTMPRLTGHLQPRRNWPTWASSVLITHRILRIWPRRTTTCSLDWKNNWKVAIFRPTRKSLLPRRPGWTDNVLNFFLSGLQKLEQQAKKFIELGGDCAEKIPSLVAVSFFLPGRTKKLSAPPRICWFWLKCQEKLLKFSLCISVLLKSIELCMNQKYRSKYEYKNRLK